MNLKKKSLNHVVHKNVITSPVTLAIPNDRRNINIKVEFKERKIARDRE